MAIAINGSSNTITGLAVGGLPNGSITAADLASGVGGKFASYAIICDKKGANTGGGTFTAGGDRTRDLNTEITDADSIVSISSNQFTLQAGTYLIKGSCPAYNVARHAAWVYDVTAGANVGEVGANAYASSNTTRTIFQVRVTISSANVYEIRHRGNTTQNTNGFGVESETSVINRDSIYTVVEIYKES
tara:strand:+ start:756 stop:1322 length:567 start_codon:yes stop_codon:yes gene_type:complete